MYFGNGAATKEGGQRREGNGARSKRNQARSPDNAKYLPSPKSHSKMNDPQSRLCARPQPISNILVWHVSIALLPYCAACPSAGALPMAYSFLVLGLD